MVTFAGNKNFGLVATDRGRSNTTAASGPGIANVHCEPRAVNTDNAANRRPDGSLVQKSSGIQYCTEMPKSKADVANLSAKIRFSTVNFVRYKFLCKTYFGRYIRQ